MIGSRESEGQIDCNRRRPVDDYSPGQGSEFPVVIQFLTCSATQGLPTVGFYWIGSVV